MPPATDTDVDTVFRGTSAATVRPVAHASARLKEAQKLGFARAVIPDSAKTDAKDSGMSITSIAGLQALVAEIAALGSEQNRPAAKAAANARRQDG